MFKVQSSKSQTGDPSAVHEISEQPRSSVYATATSNPDVLLDHPAPGRDATDQAALATDRTLFIFFAHRCAQIGSTSKKLEKTRWLADYFKGLVPAELGFVTPWFTGSPFPSTQNKVLQLGWALIRDALCAVGELGCSFNAFS
jgi:hypothetical protein